jgi:hypothetical protein
MLLEVRRSSISRRLSALGNYIRHRRSRLFLAEWIQLEQIELQSLFQLPLLLS